MSVEQEIVERVAGRMKIRKLLGTPGMDEVCLALNKGLTYQERQQAQRWLKAFKEAGVVIPEVLPEQKGWREVAREELQDMRG